MNKKQDKKPSYLETTSEYYFISETNDNYPKIIRELQLEFNSILRGIHNRIKIDSFEKEDCFMFTKRIDKSLETLGELTVKAKNNELKDLEKLKDNLWILLETLEQYCQQTYKMSIW